MRGGYVAVQISALLSGDPWPDLSNAALGAWVRLRAVSDLTGEPVTLRAADRLGISGELLAELVAAGVTIKEGDRYAADGMPRYIYPSEAPEAVRERNAASRAGIRVADYRARNENPPAPPVNSTQIKSTQGDSSLLVTTRDDGSLKDDDDRASEAYAKGPVKCAKCGAVILGASLRTGAGPMHAGGCPKSDRVTP
jgi:hypothetical protein